jgi:NitT/TauT family transport system substrate-binding protein
MEEVMNIRRDWKGGRAVALLVGVALFAAACGGDNSSAPAPAAPAPAPTDQAPGAPEVEPAEITLIIASAVALPKEEVAIFAVPQALGFFEEERLTVTIEFADGGTAATQAVASGSGDITASGLNIGFSAAERGIPIKAVGGLVVNWPWRFATLPDSSLTDCSGLQGSTIGIISLASGSYPYARAFVSECGLDPDADVNYVPTGIGAPAYAALQSGQVDALALYTAAYAAIENTGIEFGYLENPSFFDPLVSISWLAGTNLIENRPDVLERFLRAAYKGLLFSNANPEKAVLLGYEVLPGLLQGESVEARLALDVNSLATWLASTAPAGPVESWTSLGYLNTEQLFASMSLALTSGNISVAFPPEQAYDDSLLDAANDFDFAEIVALARS